MSLFTTREATEFFRSYEINCDEGLVQEWLNKANPKEIHASITEEHVWAFSDWLRRLGTAYEEGIDDKTKIERLILEIQRLEKENETLHDEKLRLEMELGISPFD